MEIFLGKVTQQAMNYAIRTGITITSGYAIRQCSRLLKTVEGDEKSELATLQMRLESKIRIVSPAIDMIELIAARGNTTLESAVTLTKALRWDIQSLGNRLAKAAAEEELSHRGGPTAKSRAQTELDIQFIISDIKKLLARIEDAVPMINLAITTSGANLSTSLPATVSPSRLLQASTFLTDGDTRYTMSPSNSSQIGPAFTLTMYMLFEGYARELQNRGTPKHRQSKQRETVWKEVMHKARVKLLRVPLAKLHHLPGQEHSNESWAANSIPGEGKAYEFAYQIVIIEDLDDDRMHETEDGEDPAEPFEEVPRAGMREIIPIHEISKIFYADTGKILSIGSEGETNTPILLLKRDVNAIPPRRMMDQQSSNQEWYEEPAEEDEDDDLEQSEISAQIHRESSVDLGAEYSHPKRPQTPSKWRLPPDLDPEWIALEVYTEAPDSDAESDTATEEPTSSPGQTRSPSVPSSLNNQMDNLHIRSSSTSAHSNPPSSPPPPSTPQTPTTLGGDLVSSQTATTPAQLPTLRTSLSLLEMLVRLTSLQQFQQTSHLAIPDELLTFFLSESSSTGAGADQERRQQLRHIARQKVGFDPYDESPVKFHGEEYQMGHPGSGFDEAGYDGNWYGYDGLSREGSADPNAPSPSRGGTPPVRASSVGAPMVGAGSPLLRKTQSRSRSGTPNQRGRGSGVGIRSPLAREVGERSGAAQPTEMLGNDSALGTSPAVETIEK